MPQKGLTPLHVSAMRGEIAIAKALLGAKAGINCTAKVHNTP